MTPEFRVWDKRCKEYSSSPGFLDSEGNYYDERIETGEPQNKDFVLEQYTRLNDVNGNKIFEGDIVSISNHPFQKHKGDLTGIDIEGNYEVNWGERDLTWLAGTWKCSKTRRYLTVIGNIHENLELLEVE